MGFPVTVVLGASGRIGRVLRHCWPQELPATASISWQTRRPVPPLSPHETQLCLDPLAQPEALSDLLQGAEVVLCLAGSIPGRTGRSGGSGPGHRDDLADNWRLGEAVVQAAAKAASQGGAPPPRVLLTSSAAVYGNRSGLLRENAPLHPANGYGAAKLEMEQRSLALAAALGVPVTALRIGNIAGLDAILGGWRAGFTLDRFSDGRSPRRSYIGVRTLARILAALVAQPQLPAVLNLAQPGPVEMAALLRAAGRDFAWRPAPEAAIAEVNLDVTELRHCLAAAGPQPLVPADPGRMLAEWAALESVFAQSTSQDSPSQGNPKESPKS